MINPMNAKRKPAVAGYFYPADAAELRREVEVMLANARPSVPVGDVVGLILPHAGYTYSGPTAAYGYSLLVKRESSASSDEPFDSVVVVGPSHREYFDGISIYPGGSFMTPLGELPIDGQLRAEIQQAYAGIILSEVGHREEHSVEVQIPFLQSVLPECRFVPIVMGDQSRRHCLALAEALAKGAKGKNILLIASSDLSHHHNYAEAVLLDRKVIHDVDSFASDALLDKLEREEVEACGGGPMVAVMMASKMLGANKSVVLFHCNSGDVTGDHDRVVGYLSAALLRVR